MGDNYNLKKVGNTKPKKWGSSEAAKRTRKEAKATFLSPTAETEPPTLTSARGTKAASQAHCEQQPQARKLLGHSRPEVRGMPQERLLKQPQQLNNLAAKPKQQQKAAVWKAAAATLP